MAKAGFVHSHLTKATRTNRPIVVQGLDEKLAHYFDNWARLEEFLRSRFSEIEKKHSEISWTLYEANREQYSQYLNSQKNIESLVKDTEKLSALKTMAFVSGQIELLQANMKTDLLEKFLEINNKQEALDLILTRQIERTENNLFELKQRISLDNQNIQRTLARNWYLLIVLSSLFASCLTWVVLR